MKSNKVYFCFKVNTVNQACKIISICQNNKIIPNKLDLVIDDGLHTPCSNINTLIFGIDKIKVGGWLVIEDISIQSQHIWMIISNLMSNNYSTYLIQCERSLIYAIERLK